MAGALQLPFPWIDGLTQRQQKQIYDDFQAVAKVLKHSGHRPVTLVIAASNSSAAGKANADYKCNGSNDAAQIQAAINELDKAGGGGGRLMFLEGTYTTGATVITVSGATSSVTLEGQDRNTTYINSAATSAFRASGAGHAVVFRNMNIATSAVGGAVIEATTAQVEVDGCQLTGFRGFYGNYGIGGQAARITNNSISVSGTNCRGVQFVDGTNEYCVGNTIVVGGAGMGIRNQPGGLGFVCSAYIADNYVLQSVKSAGAVGIYLGWNFFDYTTDSTIVGNRVNNFGTGIQVDGGFDVLVQGNHVVGCTIGIDTANNNNTTVNQVFIAGNFVDATTGGTAHIRVQLEASGTSDVVIAFNKLRGTAPAYAIVIAAGCDNCGIFFNDTYQGYTTGAVSDSGTATRRETSMFSSGVLIPAGGTTNQVLKKNSNVDQDVSWALDPAIDIAAAKGDLLVALATDSLSRLGVDRDGQLLMTDSTETLGVKWGPKITISPTQPASPRPGDIWIDTT